jgi:hypothetical protein
MDSMLLLMPIRKVTRPTRYCGCRTEDSKDAMTLPKMIRTTPNGKTDIQHDTDRMLLVVMILKMARTRR